MDPSDYFNLYLHPPLSKLAVKDVHAVVFRLQCQEQLCKVTVGYYDVKCLPKLAFCETSLLLYAYNCFHLRVIIWGSHNLRCWWQQRFDCIWNSKHRLGHCIHPLVSWDTVHLGGFIWEFFTLGMLPLLCGWPWDVQIIVLCELMKTECSYIV